MVSGLKNCESKKQKSHTFMFGGTNIIIYESTIEKKYGGCGYSCGLISERSAVRRGQSEWLILFLLQLVSVDLLSNKASQQGHTASRPTKNETENTAKKMKYIHTQSRLTLTHHGVCDGQRRAGDNQQYSVFQW